jgi:hypothetical protein
VEGPVLTLRVLESRVHPLSEFFDGLRQTRREMRNPVGTRQRSAVLTRIRDEPVFFPIWLDYYSRFFEPRDIYVIDQGSGAPADAKGFVRIPVEHESVDRRWMLETVVAEQRELLERYDVVLTVDVDEIVAPDPAWGTLDDYLAGFREQWVNCVGYEVIHIRDREPAFIPGEPVLEQRGHWFVADGYDKPALATAPTPWTVGFHGRTDDRLNLDPDLRLIHLHRLDYDICLDRHRRWLRWRWTKSDLELGLGRHNRITDEREFESWFYAEGSGDDGQAVVIERIPDRWRGVV